MPTQTILERIRGSLWFVPGLWVALAAAAALAMVGVDRLTATVGGQFPLVFGGGAEGARGLLSSIATSVITVAGVVFSITIVALQLASSQFSPRVLRNFMRDVPSQLTLGSFLGTFVYAILVLRSVRGGDDREAFVPGLAISGAIVLSLVALGMLIFFIHHIAAKIQVATIVDSVLHDATDAIERLWPDQPPEEASTASVLPREAPGIVSASSGGYMNAVEEGELVTAAAERSAVLRLEAAAGDWVHGGTPLFSVWPATAIDADFAARLERHVTLSGGRSMRQDVLYGIRQLDDVAVKALSPGINDPTSAVDCIHRIGEILLLAGRRHPPRSVHRDPDGGVRLVVAHPGFATMLDLGFDEIRHHGAPQPRILLEQARLLDTLRRELRDEHHAALRRQARLVADACEPVDDPTSRQAREILAPLLG